MKPIRWLDTPPTEAQMLAAGPFGKENTDLVASLRARVAKLEVLKPYIRHNDSCDWDPEDGGDCTCGLLPLIQHL